MRIFLIGIFLFSCVHAKDIRAVYHVTYGIIGEVGIAKTKFSTFGSDYVVEVEANTTGFAKSLSSGRNEFFQSKGKILEDGSLLPLTYFHKVTREQKKSSFILDPKKWKKVLKEKITIVKFDHENKKITEYRTKILDGKVYHDSNKVYDYYVKNDLLSLFFNFKEKSNNFNIKGKTTFYAIGADKKGKLDILPMSKEDQKDLFGDTKGHNFIAIINKPVFSSEKGELFIRLDDEGIGTVAVLKDVLLFGDIKGTMVKKDVR